MSSRLKLRKSRGEMERERAPLRLPILEWLPGETLFSVVSRMHVLSGVRLSTQSCFDLFGHRYCGLAHDFPSGIDHFVERTSEQLGDAHNLIEERTLLPYFLPFKTARIARGAVATLRGVGIGTLKFQLGLLTSRFRAHHPLKLCRACLQHDIARYGTAYWHREHQWPGVWVCTKHVEPLLELNVKANGVQRFFWVLPTSHAPYAHHNAHVGKIDAAACLSLHRLAQVADRLGNTPLGYHIEPNRLRQVYRSRLREFGLLHTALLRIDRGMVQAFLRFAAPLRVCPELSALPGNEIESALHLKRVMGPVRSGTHPLRHLATIVWLFESWEEFRSVYEQQGSDASSDSSGLIADPAPTLSDPRRARLVSLIQKEHLSVSAAAKKVGVTTGTAQAWIAAAGMRPPRRPKSVNSEIAAKTGAMLRAGMGKQEVAQAQRISVQSVTRLLRTEPRLADEWRAARFNLAQQDNRGVWIKAIHSSGNLGIKAVRAIAPGPYAWLYRNDREWLSNVTRSLPVADRRNSRPLDWEARDQKLATTVKEVARTLATERTGGGPIRLWMLGQQIPELRPKLSAIKRLPLTAQQIQVAATQQGRG